MVEEKKQSVMEGEGKATGLIQRSRSELAVSREAEGRGKKPSLNLPSEPLPRLTCSPWTLSASAQRRPPAPPHTERRGCRWDCSSDSCQRFWSRLPRTPWASGNVAFADGFPSWRNLKVRNGVSEPCFTSFCGLFFIVRSYPLVPWWPDNNLGRRGDPPVLGKATPFCVTAKTKAK